MSIKIRQFEAATNILCNGFLRESDDTERLKEMIDSLYRTADDWEENLGLDTNAISIEEISVRLNVPRTPYNLAQAIRSLASELETLDGNGTVIQLGDELKNYA